MDIQSLLKTGAIPPYAEGNYRMPTESHFGRGVLQKVSELTSGKKRILFVAGNHIKTKPEFQELQQALKKSAEVFAYEAPIKKSDFETINSLVGFAREKQADCVVAIGGGAVLDTAKCAAALAAHEGNIEEYVQAKTRELTSHGLFFIAIPTTAGTGSEVTPWATVWGSDMKKYSLASPKFLFPDVAVVDPALTDTLPAYETAVTGMDALTQAIEAYWNVNNNPVSDKYALSAIPLALHNIEGAVLNPDSGKRDNMMAASFVAGLAFSNTQTTLCHAVSYPMTAHWGVAHGQAVSLTLPEFIEYIIPVLPEDRQKDFLDAFGVSSVSEAAEKVRTTLAHIGLKTKLSELGIPEDGIPLIVREGFHPDRAKNSPKIPTPEELETMLKKIY